MLTYQPGKVDEGVSRINRSNRQAQPKHCQASPEAEMPGINRVIQAFFVGRAGLEPATNGL